MSERNWGRILRRARKRAGLTQEQLAEAVDRGQSHISQVEGGTRFPSILSFETMLNACGAYLRVSYPSEEEMDAVRAVVQNGHHMGCCCQVCLGLVEPGRKIIKRELLHPSEEETGDNR